MKFKINNRNWIIKETSKDWLLEQFKKENSDGVYCFGLTRYSEQTIYINNELHIDVKRQTLYHELMHCYIWSYIHNCDNYGEEVLCDISANSHDIIHKIVEDYFRGGKK
jgi:Zn-dependent peptidase ImmA (M78 family)